MTLTMPVWAIVGLIFLGVAWEITVLMQARLLRDLFRQLWRLTYGEEYPDAPPDDYAAFRAARASGFAAMKRDLAKRRKPGPE